MADDLPPTRGIGPAMLAELRHLVHADPEARAQLAALLAGPRRKRHRRSANGEGTIVQRKDGRWEARYFGVDVSGRWRRKSLYGKTRDEVARKLRLALHGRDLNMPVTTGGRALLSEYLPRWLETIAPSVKRTSVEAYRTAIQPPNLSRRAGAQHAAAGLVPLLGRFAVADLTVQHVRSYHGAAAKAGLSPKTIRLHHAVLQRALDDAITDGMIARNVAKVARSSLPRVGEREAAFLTPQQARRFLAASASHRLHALFLVAITTGLRRGELLALWWEHVDLDAGDDHGTIYVCATMYKGGQRVEEPKTSDSRRSIVIGRETVEALRQLRARQRGERLQAGPRWFDGGYVFTMPSELGLPGMRRDRLPGRPISAASLGGVWHELLDNAELPSVPFHSLRHTHAVLLQTAEVSDKVSQRRLGHASRAMTRRYQHVTDDLERRAVVGVERLLTESTPVSSEERGG